MSEYLEISLMPTSLGRREVEAQLSESMTLSGWHESVLRAYNILRKTKALLSKGVPPDVVLELIELMESDITAQNQGK
jgi:hypothetical protein